MHIFNPKYMFGVNSARINLVIGMLELKFSISCISLTYKGHNPREWVVNQIIESSEAYFKYKSYQNRLGRFFKTDFQGFLLK